MRIFLLVSWFYLVGSAAIAADLARESEERGDIEVGVVLDSAEQTGRANAMVRIRARREIVWSLITDCAEAVRLVPGLVDCQVMETAPDGSWQRIRHVLEYSWYLPRLTYEIRAVYDKPTTVSAQRISGDLRSLAVSWNLQTDGEYTVARYEVNLAPGFWVPHWLVQVALKRDLPKMLRALRSRAELIARR